MPLYTPHGLKIRFDEDAVNAMLEPLVTKGLDFKDVLMNVELWANFPRAISNVATIIVAYATASWPITICAAIVGYSVGEVLANVTYSVTLRRVFPQFLGGWPVAVPASLVLAISFWRDGCFALVIILPVIVVVNWFGLSDWLLVPLRRVTRPLRRARGIKVGMVELAFMAACTEAAMRTGELPNWSEYDRVYDMKEHERVGVFIRDHRHAQRKDDASRKG